MKKKASDLSEQNYHHAVQFHQVGDLVKAKSLYKKVLKSSPNHFDACHLLGLVYLQQKHLSKAEKWLKKAILISPDKSQFYLSLSNVYIEANNIGAMTALSQSYELRFSQDKSISFRLATMLVKNGLAENALPLLEQASILYPSDWQVWLQYGNCFFGLANFEQAAQCYSKVLKLNANQTDALNNLAAINLQQGELEQAKAHLLRVTSIEAEHAVANYNLANIYHQQNQGQLALNHIELALGTSPDYLEAKLLKAKISRLNGNVQLAFETYQELLEKNNSSIELLQEVGKYYFQLRQFELAKDYFESAYSQCGTSQSGTSESILSQRTCLADAIYNLAICHLQLKNYQMAANYFSELLEQTHDYFAAYAPYLHSLRQTCSWQTATAIESQLRHIIESKDVVDVPPFSMITLESSHSVEQIKVAQLWVKQHIQKYQDTETTSRRVGDRKCDERLNTATVTASATASGTRTRRIRLGYLSADFHLHATSILLARVLELHDQQKFEVFGYSYGPDDQSELRQRVVNAIENFNDVSSQSIAQVINQIKNDKLDILVDLKGFTQNSLSEILLADLAPVQINYLGYPASMGAKLVDYIIVDPFIVKNKQVEFDEQPLLMPNCYQPSDNQRTLLAPPDRKSVGLKEAQFVFAAFHQGYKLNENLLHAWSQILQACHDSVLWCLAISELAQRNIEDYFIQQGIAPGRIIFAEKVSPEQHLARLQCADLVLDSFPVNGHTSTNDALWANVPVVTIAGNTFISRVAGSILSAAELCELICENFGDYQNKAIELYQNRNKLKAITNKLTTNKLNLPLFDSEKYTRALEKLFESTLQKSDFTKN